MQVFNGNLCNASFVRQANVPWRQQSLLMLQARHRRRGSVVNVQTSGPAQAQDRPRKQKVEPQLAPVDVQGGSRHTPQHDPTELALMIDTIRAGMSSMGGGEITVSPYDTAFVALVGDLDGGDGPQFPSSIDWIVQNQLPDGSWGESSFFLIQDRIMNTLACVVALTSWNLHVDKCEKGLKFIRENMWRLAEQEEDWTLIGFEISFPSLLCMARDLGLDIPYDHPALDAIYSQRNQKLSKIPLDILHSIPTTLLHSVEGMVDLDWQRLLKLKCSDGSFRTSPAATARALKETGDLKCLKYIDEIVKKFDGGAPCVYPVDLYERLWAVDRLTRLGISRHFTSEIKECLDFTYRHWTQVEDDGLSHAGSCSAADIDDTAMGFRLLRLNGYHVNPCALKKFEKDGEFFCFPRQSSQSVTAIYNTYRATQVAFPGEKDDVLRRAEQFGRAFLQERRASNKLNDKWVIPKDLPGEVEYALDFPWKASLPRVETRFYLEQYGGGDDVWIGKVLYRMPLVNNDLYLEAAKADFTNFQRMCRLEWHGLKRWYERNNLEMYGVSANSALRAYFLAAANIFEPTRAAERLAWARTAMLAEAVSSYFQRNGCAPELRERLSAILTPGHSHNLARGAMDSVENSIPHVVDELIMDLSKFGNAADTLREAWKDWFTAWTAKESSGPCEWSAALLLVRTVEVCSGRHGSTQQQLNISEYTQLEELTSSICRKLSSRVLAQGGQKMENIEDIDRQVDLDMRELTQHVLQSCNGVSGLTRQTFMHVVKSFNYVTLCPHDTIDCHISKVLFEDII
ncbi:syn-copalyl diphosphate synthase-like isoform X1 [Triticum dicoccoides]|uniref:syn-copalyl diphosphate synthase-like isoform X1 n=1 Tax=Triticum dicoccoides TaxID=85692 RepID=UPI00188DEF0F|nr:syn-copalyl diphosphate synthase-like isoform X1 [Triticum dicoccoides]XP_037486910.1 syn-copalyl diphosphate synthase-like isoform X1 [Triticum dicoccoides]